MGSIVCTVIVIMRTVNTCMLFADGIRIPPYELIEVNSEKLEKWPLQHFASAAFATDQSPLIEMAGPAQHINLRPMLFHMQRTVQLIFHTTYLVR